MNGISDETLDTEFSINSVFIFETPRYVSEIPNLYIPGICHRYLSDAEYQEADKNRIFDNVEVEWETCDHEPEARCNCKPWPVGLSIKDYKKDIRIEFEEDGGFSAYGSLGMITMYGNNCTLRDFMNSCLLVGIQLKLKQ